MTQMRIQWALPFTGQVTEGSVPLEFRDKLLKAMAVMRDLGLVVDPEVVLHAEGEQLVIWVSMDPPDDWTPEDTRGLLASLRAEAGT